jgi:glucose/arabinose dehydrogenase
LLIKYPAAERTEEKLLKIILITAVCLSLLQAACAAPAANPPAQTEVSTPRPAQPAVQRATATAVSPTETVPAIETAAPTTVSRSTITIVPTEPPQPIELPEIALEPVFEGGLVRPTYLTHAGDDRLFVIEQPGRIRIIQDGQLLDRPFLDLTSKVLAQGNEQGLLSVAFHPDYAANGQFFVNYTRLGDGATVVERYTVSQLDPNQADGLSGKPLLVIAQPERNHNGGLNKFGPDGYLYIGMGDGGGAGDRHGAVGNGQDLDALLGKMLRIDVTNPDTYAVPPDNPFGDEIWSYGWRNPWRFSFDRATGDLYIADVGQNAYEEVHFQPAASAGGENYGWRIMEGLHCYAPRENCPTAGLVLPVAEYSHAEGGCSITGGYVYRGQQYPALTGQYFFGDYCTGYIWSLHREGDQWVMTKRLESGASISSFGEDVNGEVYVIDHGGAIYQLVAR